MPPSSAALATHLAHLKSLAALRDGDPQALLQQAATWPDLWIEVEAPAERALLETARQLLVAGAHHWLGQDAPFGLAMRLARDALDRAEGVEEALLADHRMQALHLEAYHAERHGDYAAAFRGYQATLRLAREAGHARYQATILNNLASACEEAGLFAEALAHHREALDLATRIGLPLQQGDSTHNLANAVAASGDPQGALRLHEQALAIFEALGAVERVGATRVGMAERHLEMGQPSPALDEVERALAQPRQLPLMPAYAAGVQARILQTLHRTDAARSAWLRALAAYAARSEAPGQVRAHVGLARLAQAAGQADDADHHAARAVALAEGTTATREQIEAFDCASLVHEAQQRPAQALHFARRHHAAYEALYHAQSSRRAALLAVQHAVDAARADAARHALESRRLGEALAEVAARLRQLEGAAAPRAQGPEALRGLGLTPREAEVLHWVCEGKTNDEVAAIVGTGLPAVKKNLLRIYAKLGVENRTAAAAEVRRRTPGMGP